MARGGTFLFPFSARAGSRPARSFGLVHLHTPWAHYTWCSKSHYSIYTTIQIFSKTLSLLNYLLSSSANCCTAFFWVSSFFSFLGPLLAASEAELHHRPLLAGLFSFMFCEIIRVTPSNHVLGPPKA